VDRWWAFDDYDTDEMRACHEILCRRADHVFASALELRDDCRVFTDRVSYVPHGVDWAHFRRAVDEDLPRPDDVPNDGHPVVGFIGLIDQWIDLDLLKAVARRIAPAHLVLIGQARVDVSALAAESNVHLLGRKAFADLPAYCRAFDTALIPFLVNDLTRAVNPIKLREYLSAGLPVVSTPLPEIVPFADRPGTTLAAEQESFVAAVVAKIGARLGPTERRQLSDAMKAESWEGRLASMLQTLDTITPQEAK
jgi:glycosyltransferase involved in cell wall biosynthesis